MWTVLFCVLLVVSGFASAMLLTLSRDYRLLAIGTSAGLALVTAGAGWMAFG